MYNTAIKTSAEQTNGNATVVEFSRDEMNLAEFPLAVLSTRTNPNIKTLEFSDTAKSPNGELIKRDWIITGSDRFGLPTSTDDDVILGLICLSKQSEFKERKVYFTRYELLKILRWTTEGRSYKRLEKSLNRLTGVRIISSNAFYDNASKVYLTKNVGIIDTFGLKDERVFAKNPDSYFVWSEAMFNSFKAGYIRKINLSFYFALNSAVARRLYRYLDKYFYFNPVIKKPLIMFAFEKLGLSRTYKYVSSIKQQIVPACKELVEKGFLESFEFSGSGEDTIIHFTKKGDTARLEPKVVPMERKADDRRGVLHTPGVGVAGSVGDNTNDQDSRAAVADLLTERGILPKQASRLLENCSEDELHRITEIVDYFDTLVQSRDPKISKNPIGFLYRAVENPHRFKLPGNTGGDRRGESSFARQSDSHRDVRRGVSAFAGASTFAKATADKTADRSHTPGVGLAGADHKAREAKLKQAAYEQYRTCMVDAYKKNIAEDVLCEIQARVEAKVRHLKTILKPKNYIEARDGLVKQELATAAGVVNFDEWKKMVGG